MLVVISEAVKHFAAPEGGVIAALDSVSLDVGGSEFVTLLGPSGCGKTTLLRAISGFEDLDSGGITIDGQAMDLVPPHKRPVNTVFQNYALFPHLTVGDNIGYGLDVTGCPKAERKKRLTDALELVGLAGFEKRRPRQLSGGQQQRVALARAIVNRPKLLLLDEPLSALDRKLRQSMQLELKNIQNELGISFVFVTHDQEEALTMSDRIIVMDHGRVQQMGTPTEIYDAPASVFVAQFIGESNLFEGTLKRDGAATVVETEDGLHLVVGDTRDELSNGAQTTVLIRPEDLHLAEQGMTVSDEQATIEANLLQTIFVGADFQVVARAANNQEIKATIRDPSRRLASRLRHGETIRLCYSRDATRLLPSKVDA